MPKHEGEDQGQYEHQAQSTGRKGMKRLLALLIVWTLLVLTGTLVSADGEMRDGNDAGARVASDITNVTK